MRSLLRLLPCIAFLFVSLSAGQVAAQTPPAWAPNVNYPVNARVTFDALVWEALQAHRSQLGWEPPNVPALFRRPADAPGVVQEWAPGKSYALNARVTFMGTLFEARQGHTSQLGWEPFSAPSLWQMPAEDATREWVAQKRYRAGDFALFQGEAFRALQTHVSVVGAFPPDSPSLWALAPLVDSCAAPGAEGALCFRPFLSDVFNAETAVAHCRSGQCVRDHVPEAVYDYPWQGVGLSVSDVPELIAALAQVEANPNELFTIFLSPGEYVLTDSLRLTRGNVILHGDPDHPEATAIVAGGTRRFELIRLGNQTPVSPPPLLAVRGITLEGARSPDQGGAIISLNAGLILEHSIIQENQAERSAGILAFRGFFSMDNCLVERNLGNNVDDPADPMDRNECGIGLFTLGGGVTVQETEEAYIRNSSIVRNQHCRAAGVFLAGGRLFMSQNTVAQNFAPVWGGAITVTGDALLRMHFNTVLQNDVGTIRPTGQNNFGAGLAFRGFSGRLSMVGNVVANNRRFNGQAIPPSPREGIEFTYDNFSIDTVLPSPFVFLRETQNFIGVENHPSLSNLGFFGRGVGFLELPTYRPASAVSFYQSYMADPSDPETAILAKDQRGFDRPSLMRTTPGSVDPDAVFTPPPPLGFEAENGNPSAPLQIFTDNPGTLPPSGGAYVEVAPGNNRNAAPPATGVVTGVMEFPITVVESGQYRIWGRVIAPTPADDSFWIRMDGGPWIQWNGIPLGGDWHWDDVHDSSQAGSPVVSFDLNSEFLHTLEVAYREDGTKLDKLVIALDPTFVPTGTGP